MDSRPPYKIVVLSDLHLSEGWDEEGFLSKNEDFFFDCNFQRFVEYLYSEARKGEFRYKLVINGDFADFLQVGPDAGIGEIEGEALTKREQKLGPGTTLKKNLWKLKGKGTNMSTPAAGISALPPITKKPSLRVRMNLFMSISAMTIRSGT